MDRRELLRRIAILTGGVVVGGEIFLTGCTNTEQKVVPGLVLSESDIPFLDEVAETILPATKTPGAKAAKVGQFMVVYVNDCYNDDEKKVFREGLASIEEACKKTHNKSFMEVTPEQRTAVITEIDRSTRDFQRKFREDQEAKEKAARDRGDEKYQQERMPLQYFSLVKQLTLLGYFTSQEGVTKALRYIPVPTKWEPIIDYKKGEAMFAGLNGANV